jgi:hypothetical protein
MKATLRFLAIGVLAFALASVWACSSTKTTAGTGPSTTTAGASSPANQPTTTAGAPAQPSSSIQSGTMATTAAGAAAGAASAAGLTSTLGSSLGLSTDQASGAVGSVMALAQTKLPASDYTKVASALPGSDTYVQKAKDLGVDTSSITDMNGLNAAYSKLGISPEVGSQITPLVVNYVGKAAGPTVGGLLSSVLK